MTTKGKPVYFTMLRGLRGCYMPDASCTAAVRSYAEFKRHLEFECDTFEMLWNTNDENEQSPELIEAICQEAWRHVQKPGYLGLCIAIGADYDHESDTTRANESYGITVHSATRGDYVDYRRAMRDDC